MSEPARILTVCTGNICRSPFIERALQSELDREWGPGSGAGAQRRHRRHGRRADEPARAARTRRLPGMPRTASWPGPSPPSSSRRRTSSSPPRAGTGGSSPSSTRRRCATPSRCATSPTSCPTSPASPTRRRMPGCTSEALVERAGERRGMRPPLSEEEADVVDPYRLDESVFAPMTAQIMAALPPVTSAPGGHGDLPRPRRPARGRCARCLRRCRRRPRGPGPPQHRCRCPARGRPGRECPARRRGASPRQDRRPAPAPPAPARPPALPTTARPRSPATAGIVAVDGETAWRFTVGTCADGGSTLSITTDGGATWQPRVVPFDATMRIRVRDDGTAFAIGSDAECAPRFRPAERGAAQWGAEVPVPRAWYRDPKNPAIVGTAAGTRGQALWRVGCAGSQRHRRRREGPLRGRSRARQ